MIPRLSPFMNRSGSVSFVYMNTITLTSSKSSRMHPTMKNSAILQGSTLNTVTPASTNSRLTTTEVR